MMSDGIRRGVVVPLNRTVYDQNKVEEAFRFMASGRHIGKVLVRIRDEEKGNQTFLLESMQMEAISRTVFHPNKSYLVTGGLGGMGLEIIEWMIERGAKKFVITSRTGPKESFQFSKLKHFGDIGVEYKVWTKDIIDLIGCKALLSEAMSLGPIGGIFHLSLVMSDGLFENQSIESFDRVFGTKSKPLVNLDLISRQMCSELDYFVVFSSIVSSRGNAGQTNYGFSNDIMERICEQRRADGLPALAVQWGPVGDVGFVTENITEEDYVLSIVRSQRMFSCLQTLDKFLQMDVTVCSSFVVNDSNRRTESFGERKSLLERVSHILGHKEFQKFDPKTRLSELGMDSLMSVEIKQTIERDFDLILSTQEIQNLTIDGIQEIETKSKKSIKSQTKNELKINTSDKVVNKSVFQIPNEEIIFLNSVKDGKKLIYLPPTDGTHDLFRPIAEHLKRPVIGLNWTEDCLRFESAKETALHFLEVIQKRFPSLDFDLIGYSYGVFVALEMSSVLQKKHGLRPELIALDMCPIQMRNDYISISQELFGSDEELNLIFTFLMDKISVETKEFADISANIPKEKRIERISEYFWEKSFKNFGLNEVMFAIRSHVQKMKHMFSYSSEEIIEGNVLLLRADQHLVRSELHFIAPDYGFKEVFIQIKS